MYGYPGHRGYGKPARGRQVDWGHPQAAGLRLFCLLNEGTGPPFDVAGKVRATVTGAPTWQSTAAGLARGGYSTSNYDAIDPPKQVLGLVYPWWVAVSYATTGSALQTTFSQGASGNSGTTIAIYTTGAGGSVQYVVFDNVSAGPNVFVGSVGSNNGLPHVSAMVARGPSQFEFWHDGKLGTTSTATIGTLTNNQLSLGVNRTTTVGSPLAGQVFWLQAGNGAVPDMAWMAREPFAPIQGPGTRRFFAMGGSTGRPAVYDYLARRRRAG